jgi:hypothetical protein
MMKIIRLDKTCIDTLNGLSTFSMAYIALTFPHHALLLALAFFCVES